MSNGIVQVYEARCTMRTVDNRQQYGICLIVDAHMHAYIHKIVFEAGQVWVKPHEKALSLFLRLFVNVIVDRGRYFL